MAVRGDVDVDLVAIRRTTAQLVAAVNASDTNRVVEAWADDGVLMPPAHPAVQGRAALLEYFGNLFARARFAFDVESSAIEVSDGMAIERVSYKVTMWPANGLGPLVDHGKGLHVYRRQSDGTWKLFVDIWNSDQPPAA
jgi:ketosteroid isomerase-like protein